MGYTYNVIMSHHENAHATLLKTLYVLVDCSFQLLLVLESTMWIQNHSDHTRMISTDLGVLNFPHVFVNVTCDLDFSYLEYYDKMSGIVLYTVCLQKYVIKM